MIFSREINRREKEKAVKQAVEQARAEKQALEQERAEWLAWFRRNESRIPKDTEPPPGITRNHPNNNPD